MYSGKNHSLLAFEVTCQVLDLFFGTMGIDDTQYEVRQMDEETVRVLLTTKASNQALKSLDSFSTALQHIVRKVVYEKLKFKRPLFIKLQREINFKKSFEKMAKELEQRPPSPRLNRFQNQGENMKQRHYHNLTRSHALDSFQRLPHHQQNEIESSTKISPTNSYLRSKNASLRKEVKPVQGSRSQAHSKLQRLRPAWKKVNMLEQEKKEKIHLAESRLFNLQPKV